MISTSTLVTPLVTSTRRSAFPSAEPVTFTSSILFFSRANTYVSRASPVNLKKSWSSRYVPSHQRNISRAMRFSPCFTYFVMSKRASSLLSSLYPTCFPFTHTLTLEVADPICRKTSLPFHDWSRVKVRRYWPAWLRSIGAKGGLF